MYEIKMAVSPPLVDWLEVGAYETMMVKTPWDSWGVLFFVPTNPLSRMENVQVGVGRVAAAAQGYKYSGGS